MGDTYIFNGYRRTAYFKYRDLDSDVTLIAEPGEQYRIEATEPGIVVPPPDGMWAVAPAVSVRAKREAAIIVKPAAQTE